MPANTNSEAQEAEILSEAEDSGLNVPPETLRRMAAEEEERRELIREFISRNLKSGTDYGTISLGRRESKPSLFKPGAEKICLLLGWRPTFSADTDTLAMLGPGPGTFAYLCRLVDSQGRIVGEGRGVTELREQSRWTVNVAMKVALKRAMVDAVLRVAGLSDVFSQEIEEGDPARTAGGNTDADGEPAPPPPRRNAEGQLLATPQQLAIIQRYIARGGLTEERVCRKANVEALEELTRIGAARLTEQLIKHVTAFR